MAERLGDAMASVPERLGDAMASVPVRVGATVAVCLDGRPRVGKVVWIDSHGDVEVKFGPHRLERLRVVSSVRWVPALDVLEVLDGS